ncbi:DUF2933 domain-containing protein [Paenibacillus lutimineralis]|uniref:DUF2933 domain-containing protein n=1 Tax=Paenibacillus lutimineralis TaxID=2707005 RepID=A0A3Q9IBP8_9BACL|nr:DUF2933 domain-containing protein [Paenibacillus lutimineralis]AZS15495.1 DUF2933 domain-containing protein [Paenibacillus lutimineralis]
MDWTWLLLLACPLMMVFMMFGMGGMYKHGSQNEDKYHQHEDHVIHRELSELRAQNEQMRQEIQNLKQSH